MVPKYHSAGIYVQMGVDNLLEIFTLIKALRSFFKRKLNLQIFPKINEHTPTFIPDSRLCYKKKCNQWPTYSYHYIQPKNLYYYLIFRIASLYNVIMAPNISTADMIISNTLVEMELEVQRPNMQKYIKRAIWLSIHLHQYYLHIRWTPTLCCKSIHSFPFLWCKMTTFWRAGSQSH